VSLVQWVDIVLNLGHGEFSRLIRPVQNPMAHLTRRRPCLGAISFRKDLPICAEAKGTRPLLNSSNRAKLTKWP
jgi:hypothetical protein